MPWLLLALAALVGILVFFLVTPFLLASLARIRNHSEHSSLYLGRVSHTRLLPKVHGFAYPIFCFGIDLDRIDEFHRAIGPLSWIVRLRDVDHLRNGEGGPGTLAERVRLLVASKTKGLEYSRILLVTHLAYYGYCFNPVSFYYLLNDSNETQAIVAEVSNTPWNELHCYVLHASSSDTTESKKKGPIQSYVFPKTFHVSPFMEMDYCYHWNFEAVRNDTMNMDMTLQRKDTVHFRASLKLDRVGLDPFQIAKQLTLYPVYCAWLQLWIHIQAFYLFYKGIAYQPHPEGSETTMSLLIGKAMVPLFALQAWIKRKRE